jgi:beta-galactosidase
LVKADIALYEVLEPSSAAVRQGRSDRCRYTRAAAGHAAVVSRLYASLGVEVAPKTPDGVYARAVKGGMLHVNTTDAPRAVTIQGNRPDVLTGKRWSDTSQLPAWGVDLLGHP